MTTSDVSAVSAPPTLRIASNLNQNRLSPILIAPGLAILIGGFLFPVAQILLLSFVPETADLPLMSNFVRFFEDGYYLNVAWRTLRLSIYTSVVCVMIGFPLAFAISKASPRLRALMLMLTVLPLLTGVVVRTFSWMIVLGRGGVVSETLKFFGVSPQASVFLHTETGIVIAMVHLLLPMMTLTILGVISAIHPHLEEVSRTMGANFYKTLRYVVFPLSLPGIISGSLLVFTISISSFVTPSLVGGGRIQLMAGSIFSLATRTLEWHFAAAQSALLLVTVVALLVPYMLVLRPRNG